MWTRTGGFKEEGFDGDTWGDTAAVAKCVPVLDEMWNAYTGIYDERCLADPACDALRLQTYSSQTVALPVPKLTAFNYLLGPVTFFFDIALSGPPTAVKLKIGLNGGNGGNPLQRSATLPDEEFVIQVP